MKRAWNVVVAITVLVAVVIGVLAFVTPDSGTLVLRLERGDCVDLPESIDEGSLGTLDRVDCDDDHEAEVIEAGAIEGADPDRSPYESDAEAGGAAVMQSADARCQVALESIDGAVDRFGVLPVVADERSWKRFPGRFVCLAIPYGGGSVAGSIAT